MSPSPPIRFGIFEVDPEHGEVRRQGVKISLQDQPLRVLLALLARAPHVVTREDPQNNALAGGYLRRLRARAE